MSFCISNGVRLDLLNSQPCERKDVFSDDQTTYLWTEWTLDLIVELNPVLNAYIPTGGVQGQGGVRAPNQTTPPSLSEQSIRHILMQSRGRLIYVVGNQKVVDVTGQNGPVFPLPAGLPGNIVPATDAWLGPIPQDLQILRFAGEFKTWVLRYKIKFFLNECQNRITSTGRAPILLSNRWKMVVDVDEQDLTTRYIQGNARFRLDLLAQAGLNADQFRSVLIHPCPPSFTRTAVHAELSSDGVSYDYWVVDKEVYSQLNLNNTAVPTQVIKKVRAWQTNYVQGALLAGAIVRTVRETGRGARGGGGVVGGGIGLIEGAVRSLPTSYSHYLVQVWGGAQSGAGVNTRRRLQQLALSVIFSRYNVGDILASSSFEAYVTHDLTMPYVEASMTLQRGIIGTSVQNGEAVSSFYARDATTDFGFPNQDAVQGGGYGTLLSPFQRDAITPPNSGLNNTSGTRGRYVGSLIAQSLQQPCFSPAGIPLQAPGTSVVPNNVDVALVNGLIP